MTEDGNTSVVLSASIPDGAVLTIKLIRTAAVDAVVDPGVTSTEIDNSTPPSALPASLDVDPEIETPGAQGDTDADSATEDVKKKCCCIM